MAKIDLRTTAHGKKDRPLPERVTELLNRDFKFGGSGLSNAFKERFYSDLHVLVSSGLDLRSAFEVLTGEAQDGSEQQLLEVIRVGIFAGRPFATVLSDSGQFSEYEVFTIRIGEETGALSEVLGNLATDFQDRIRLRRELMTAFSYPMMVTVVAFLAVAFMLVFVVPLFSDLFARMGQELPWLTRQVVALSNMFGAYWWLTLLLIFAIGGGFYMTQRDPKFRARSQYASLKLPWFGSIMRESKLARFSGSMAFLLGANVNLLRALKLSADMTDFAPISDAARHIEEGLIKGDSLRDLMKAHPIFDSRFIALIKVGEEVNQLGQVLRHLSGQYSDQVQRRTKLLSTFIEPIMIGFLGVLVGVILVSMYLPLFEMNSSFN